MRGKSTLERRDGKSQVKSRRKCLDLSGRATVILIDIYYMAGGAFLGTLFLDRKSLVYLATVVFAFMLLLRYSCKQYNRREILWIFPMLCTGVLCACVTKEYTLVISVICIFACMNVERAGLFQILLVEKTGFLAVSAVSAALGVIPTQSGNYERLYSLFGSGTVYRRSLGFMNYNVLGLIVFELMTLYVFFIREKYRRNLKAEDYAFLVVTLVLSYAVSGSRTALFGGIVLLAAMALSDLGWFRPWVLKAMITAALMGGSCVFSFGIVLLHDFSPVLYQKLDSILQARLRFVYRYMVKFGVRIFGNNTKDLTGFWGNEPGFDWISLDCGYAVMMIKYGVLVTALIVFLHLMYLYGRKYTIERYVLCVMLAVSIYNISENVLVFPTMNFALLYLADVVGCNQNRRGG